MNKRNNFVIRSMAVLLILAGGLLCAQEDIEFIDSDACSDCHEESSNNTLIEDDLSNSSHADLECLDCHLVVQELGIEHSEGYESDCQDVCESCGICHAEASAEFNTSVHGISIWQEDSDTEAAYCYNCHGSHNILPADDPESLTYPPNLANTCGQCHAKPELVEKYNIPDLHPVELFSKSYHAKELGKNGNLLAATCNDCHGVHDIKTNTDPTSTISHSNISTTCGVCHKPIYELYTKSVHWEALVRGERESPSCIDCHGEHEIVDPHDPDSPVSKRRSAEKTCARCHTDERIISKYGLMPGKVSSYQDSYHGLAVIKGDEDAATCYDCHDAHYILSADDARSTIHLSNLSETCGECHPGATEKFSQSYTHQSVILAEKPVEYYVKIVYIILIIVVIGGMFIHNLIIFIEYLIDKYQNEAPQDYIQRYSKSQVYQHILLIISFFTLVITGFALKYLDAFWADLLGRIGLTETVRGIVHRSAAVLMIVLSIWHIIEAIVAKRGRQFMIAMLPGISDIKGFYQLMLYSLHLTKEEPQFERFDYTEKAEYWALIWGTIVMVVTGFILWFPVFFTQYTPIWMIKVAEVLHLYEAWLATLAILVWHIFFVMFHPKEYPMSMTWIHGRMTIAEYKHKHPLDYQRTMNEVEAVKNGSMPLEEANSQAQEYVMRHKLKYTDHS